MLVERLSTKIPHEVRISEQTNHTVIDGCNSLREFFECDLKKNTGPIGQLDENEFGKIMKIEKSKFQMSGISLIYMFLAAIYILFYNV